MKSILIIILSLTFLVLAQGQPSNDDCLDAIFIPSVDNYCSAEMAFNNVGATPDPSNAQAAAQCIGMSFDNGVWFRFRPALPAVLIEVNASLPFGTAGGPKVILYSGSCTSGLDYILCGPGNLDNVEMTVSGLTLGETYYLYVETQDIFQGTFQLCIDEFIAPPSPESDCDKAVVLCSEDPFFVDRLSTAGDDTSELSEFRDRCLSAESQSVWYKWTCETAGSLSFTLTPNNWVPGVSGDDLDFAVFELPNGIDDCTDKEMIRCMASGGCSGSPFNSYLPCTGPTGLALASTDIEEDPGCLGSICQGGQGDDDNFVAAIQMEANKSYALVVNNYDNSGKGFSIEFGGTGTFLGPKPDFNPEVLGDVIACDKIVEYTDLSNELTGDPIVSWAWNFGVRADPPTEFGRGPHRVIYESFGPKSVLLTVESARGCLVNRIIDIYVEPCCSDTISTLDLELEFSEIVCPGETAGFIEASGVAGSPEYMYSINGGDFQSNSFFDQLGPGVYDLTVQDIKGCDTTKTIIITEPDGVLVDAGANLEIDLGFQDTLNATVMPPGANVTYAWDPEEGLDCVDSDLVDCPDPIVVSPGTTTYTVSITDENGCISTDQVTVRTIIVRPIYAPNAISPESRDGNAVFKLGFGRQAVSVQNFVIYDRWGGPVYEGQNIELDQNNEMISGWDGRFGGVAAGRGSVYVQPGVFVWYAEVLFIDGEVLPFSGDLTIIR